MLFDLRSRGRRTTVRGIYLGLAILMGSGLVLFGVGTGVGGGGLFGAFTGGGSSNSSQPVLSQTEKDAIQQTKQNPNSAAAWSALVQARWDSAKGSDFNASTGTFTAAGQTELANAIVAWRRYSQLTKHPDSLTATIAARVYALQGNYAASAKTWEVVTGADPTDGHAFQCYAASAYAAKQTRLGDLAMSKALDLAPKLQRPILKEQIQAAKTNPQIAQGC